MNEHHNICNKKENKLLHSLFLLAASSYHLVYYAKHKDSNNKKKIVVIGVRGQRADRLELVTITIPLKEQYHLRYSAQ